MKEALLTVSFGTAVEQARQADICAVERTVAQALPHLPAYQAYTSPTIRRILARRGIDIPGFVPALEILTGETVHLRLYLAVMDKIRADAGTFERRMEKGLRALEDEAARAGKRAEEQDEERETGQAEREL